MLIAILGNKKATSTMEYVLLIIIILGALLLSQRYILRGFAGRWKAVGDSFGQGKQYDPTKTAECVWSQNENKWYGPDCFDQYWNTHFPSLVYNCSTSCVSGGNTSACGGGPTGCSIRFTNWHFFWESNCCHEACNKVCSDFVTRSGINACLTVNGVPCNN